MIAYLSCKQAHFLSIKHTVTAHCGLVFRCEKGSKWPNKEDKHENKRRAAEWNKQYFGIWLAIRKKEKGGFNFNCEVG